MRTRRRAGRGYSRQHELEVVLSLLWPTRYCWPKVLIRDCSQSFLNSCNQVRWYLLSTACGEEDDKLRLKIRNASTGSIFGWITKFFKRKSPLT